MITPDDIFAADLTDETYECIDTDCSCGRTLFSFCQPDYGLMVGVKVGFPKELLFSTDEVNVSVRPTPDDDLAAYHAISTGQNIFWTCSECGSEVSVALAGPDGDEFLYNDRTCDVRQRRVPTRCVPYIESLDAFDPEYVKRHKESLSY